MHKSQKMEIQEVQYFTSGEIKNKGNEMMEDKTNRDFESIDVAIKKEDKAEGKENEDIVIDPEVLGKPKTCI